MPFRTFHLTGPCARALWRSLRVRPEHRLMGTSGSAAQPGTAMPIESSCNYLYCVLSKFRNTSSPRRIQSSDSLETLVHASPVLAAGRQASALRAPAGPWRISTPATSKQSPAANRNHRLLGAVWAAPCHPPAGVSGQQGAHAAGAARERPAGVSQQTHRHCRRREGASPARQAWACPRVAAPTLCPQCGCCAPQLLRGGSSERVVAELPATARHGGGRRGTGL